MALSPFPVFVDRLRQRLSNPLPGADAQVQMAPRYEARRQGLSIEGRDCREAGVLALLYPDVSEAASAEWAESSDSPVPHVVLTVRRDELPDHPGQISFPGGQREGSETLQATALREAQEEVALAPAPVDILGGLTPLYIPPSGFCVHPFIGVVSDVPDLRPTDREVGEILRVPLPHLLHPSTRVVEPWTLHGRTIDVPYYDVAGHTVWGATAMMLSELLAVVRSVTSPARNSTGEDST